MIELEDIKRKIRPVLDKHGIQKAGLFGSAVRKGEAVNDIDLLVRIDRDIGLLEFVAIKQGLEDVLNMKMDLVEYDTLKPSLKKDVLEEEVSVL